MPNPDANPRKPKPRRSWLRWFFVTGLVTFAVLLTVLVVVVSCSYPALKAFVQSSEGQRLAAMGLGKAIKVDGEFSPFTLDGWTLKVDSFQSVGWPGEALGGLDAQGVVAEYDPSAILDRAWEIKGIQIASAQISLLPPDDAKKRKMPPKGPKPWYAFMLPDRFVCGPMICPNAKLVYTFQDKMASIHDAHVQGDLIGKNMQYTATSGVIEMPYLPPMHINYMKMLVTRPSLTVYGANFVGINPGDPMQMNLKGFMGQREDKTIEATGDFADLPLEQVLPENLRPLISGLATGNLVWNRNADGSITDSVGQLSIKNLKISGLAIFKQTKLLTDNPALEDFVFSEASLKYHLHNGHVTLDVIAKCPDKFSITGTIEYEFKTKHADLDLAIADIPLQVWLPAEFRPRYNGLAHAHVVWHGDPATVKDSNGTLALNFDGTQINKPPMLRKLLAKKGIRVPDEIFLKTAQFDFVYSDQSLTITRADLDAPGILTANINGNLDAEQKLNATVAWQGLMIQDWLPEHLADDFTGDIQGKANVDIHRWKMKDGSYGGDMKLVNGQLSYMPFQSLLARFVNDPKLLNLPLTRASFSWAWNGNGLSVKNIDLRGRDLIGVKGNFAVNADKELTGTLWIGTKPEYLDSFSGLGNAVFSKKDEGLLWASVDLAGTIKKPQQNLTKQITSQIGDHPLAIFGLAAKMISWQIGDWFGEAKNWERPAPADAKPKPNAKATK